MSLVKEYPVRFYALVVAALQLATAYGLTITAEQQAATMAVVGAALALVTDKFTTPNFKAVQLEVKATQLEADLKEIKEGN